MEQTVIENSTNFSYAGLVVPSSDHLVYSDRYKLISLICAICIVLTAFLGFIGNTVSFLVFVQPPMKRTPINILLAGLACVDIVVVLLGGCVFATLGIYSFSLIPKLAIAIAYLTKYVYPVAMMAQTASIWTLVLITVERFVAVFYPLHARDLCTTTRTRTALTITVSMACAYNFVRFWEYEVRPDDVNGAWADPTLRNDETYQTFYIHWAYLSSHYVVPFGVLLILNSLIVQRIQQAKSLRQNLSRQETREHRTATMMTIVILIFFICNSMALVLNTIEASGTERNDEFFAFVDASNLLVEVNSAVNFFVYYNFNRKFRLVLVHLLKSRRRRSDVPKPNESAAKLYRDEQSSYMELVS